MPELLDIYDRRRHLTGEVLPRGAYLPEGRYHLGVYACLLNGRGELLLTRRIETKRYGGLWEYTGGCVCAGETTLSAAVREVEEEIGVTLDPREAVPVCTEFWEQEILDTWLFYRDAPLEALRLQAQEVTDARWVSRSECLDMEADGLLAPPLLYGLHRLLESGWQNGEEGRHA